VLPLTQPLFNRRVKISIGNDAECTEPVGMIEMVQSVQNFMAQSSDVETAPLRFLVVRASFATLGGAERDLLQVMRGAADRWSLGLATLELTSDAEALLEGAAVKIHQPQSSHHWADGAVAELSAKVSRDAQKAWGKLEIPWAQYDVVHLTVCKGTLEILPYIPARIAVHYHCLEPPRWLYEDVLHRHPNGRLKRPLWITKLIFTRQRIRDKAFVRRLISRPHSSISGNSLWIQRRIHEVYGLESDPTKGNGEPPKRDASGRPLEATHVLPVVDIKHWPRTANKEEKEEVSAIENLPKDYIVTVGRVSHVKGTWETLQSLIGTGLTMVQVGGGSEHDRTDLLNEGKRVGVPILCMPRLSQPALRGLIRGARAMVSHAHKEPFGLTPIEAMAIGVPALMVNEGGFAHTLASVESGRLIPRNDMAAWKAAYLDAKDPELRKKWATAGRAYVEENFTTPVQIAALERMLTE
jgi:glycosyltransferase involved in cell wall biosynthesis